MNRHDSQRTGSTFPNEFGVRAKTSWAITTEGPAQLLTPGFQLSLEKTTRLTWRAGKAVGASSKRRKQCGSVRLSCRSIVFAFFMCAVRVHGPLASLADRLESVFFRGLQTALLFVPERAAGNNLYAAQDRNALRSVPCAQGRSHHQIWYAQKLCIAAYAKAQAVKGISGRNEVSRLSILVKFASLRERLRGCGRSCRNGR